jgi:hypothetical protein
MPAKSKRHTAMIRPSDVLFECPHCQKSMVVEATASGMIINCVQCGKPITIPNRPPPNPAQLEQFLKDSLKIQENMLAQLTKVCRQFDELAGDRAELIRLANDNVNLLQNIKTVLGQLSPPKADAPKPPGLIKFG